MSGALVERTTSGDPDSPLRWTSKSVRHVADELQALGHAVSHQLVAQLLRTAGPLGEMAQRQRPEHHPDLLDAALQHPC